MQAARKQSQLSEPFQTVKLFADLSQFTIQARKLWNPITSTLQQNNILYKWSFPMKIIVTKNGVTHIIKTVDSGLSRLKILGLGLPTVPSTSKSTQKPKISPKWSNGKRVT